MIENPALWILVIMNIIFLCLIYIMEKNKKNFLKIVVTGIICGAIAGSVVIILHPFVNQICENLLACFVFYLILMTSIVIFCNILYERWKEK